MTFKSRQFSRPRSERFTTDAGGRYCIVWAKETSLPSIRLADGSDGGSLRMWEPLNGAPPPRNCDPGDHGIPPNRARNTTDLKRHQPLGVLGVLGIFAFLVPLALGARDLALVSLGAGFILTLANTLIAALT